MNLWYVIIFFRAHRSKISAFHHVSFWTSFLNSFGAYSVSHQFSIIVFEWCSTWIGRLGVSFSVNSIKQEFISCFQCFRLLTLSSLSWLCMWLFNTIILVKTDRSRYVALPKQIIFWWILACTHSTNARLLPCGQQMTCSCFCLCNSESQKHDHCCTKLDSVSSCFE